MPSLAFPALPALLPAESSFTPGLGAAGVEGSLEPAGAAGVPLDSEAALETLGLSQQPEQPDDPQQLPQQIRIQQRLKLHFHSQGGVSRGPDNDADP